MSAPTVSPLDETLARAQQALQHCCNLIKETKDAINNSKVHHYSRKAIPQLQQNLKTYTAQAAQQQQKVKSQWPDLSEPWKLHIRKKLETLTQRLKAFEKDQTTKDKDDSLAAEKDDITLQNSTYAP